jgi:hypothetical protein
VTIYVILQNEQVLNIMLALPIPSNQPTFGVPSVNTLINKEKQESLYVEERRPGKLPGQDRVVRYLKGKFLGKVQSII